jgi:hypothetical protein
MFRGQTRCGGPPRPPCPRKVTVPGEEPTAGHRLRDGRPDPGQARPDRTGTVPPRRTREPACRPAGHHGADPRPNRPRRPLVRAAAPADGARQWRQRVHEGHRPRQWRLWPSSRSTSRHPVRSPAAGRLATHPAGLVEDLAHVLLGWSGVLASAGSPRRGYRDRLTSSGAGWRAGWPAAGAGPLRRLEWWKRSTRIVRRTRQPSLAALRLLTPWIRGCS